MVPLGENVGFILTQETVRDCSIVTHCVARYVDTLLVRSWLKLVFLGVGHLWAKPLPSVAVRYCAWLMVVDVNPAPLSSFELWGVNEQNSTKTSKREVKRY